METAEKVKVSCPSCETLFYTRASCEDELYACPHCMALMVVRDGQPILEEDIP